MQRCLRPRDDFRCLLQLENQPVRPRPKRSCAVEVAMVVENEACCRVGPILSIKTVQPRLRPFAALSVRRNELEHDAATSPATSTFAFSRHVVATEVRRAVDCTLAVEHQAAVGIRSVPEIFSRRDAFKAVQHFLRPLSAFGLRRTQLEHRPAILIVGRVATSVSAAVLSCAVQVALIVKRQVAPGKIAVLAALKTVKHYLCPGSALLLWRH